MRPAWTLLVVAVALLTGTALAQDLAPKGWLGVELQDVSKEEADKLRWEAPRGAKVIHPTAGSPAAAAGLEPDDVIAAIDGVDVREPRGIGISTGG